MSLSESSLYEALRQVIDPDLRRDIVSAGMVKGLAWNIQDRKLSLTLQLTTPACPLKDYFREEVHRVLIPVLGDGWQIEVAFSAQTVGVSTDALPNVRNLVLVGSGKGGVGKSTISVNLAVALAHQGARTGLVDADIYGPSVPILLGLEAARPSVEEKEGKPYLVPLRKYGIEVMSIGFLVPPGQATPWRGPMASNTLRQLLLETAWGELDYLIVDMPPGTGDIQLTLAQQFRPTGAILVTTPQRVAQADVEKALTMLRMPLVQVPILGIVENMAYFWTPELPERKFLIFGEGGGSMLAQKYGVPLLAQIPLTEEVVHYSDKGIPVAMLEENPVGIAFRQLAGEVVRAIAKTLSTAA
ncbi:MAG: Mrp/NBP35 family ATP-binding protein [Bacteroidia bacterium]|nr:Mrp/NBP35 family ATP-binding protein [Bacteroidia bacterium]MDW8235647.1 P-loop NTPase [Bacteroidia bacterium]